MFYKVTVKLDKQTDKGEKSIQEQYLLEALSFTEAEANVIEQVTPYCSGALQATKILPARYNEVFQSSDSRDDRFYEVRIKSTSIDDKGKIKDTAYAYIVQAQHFQDAVNNFHRHMDNSMLDFRITSVTETKFLDYFPHSL